MKIAIISDIHANLNALEKVMEDIKKQGCEKVLCLGDLAMAGPQPQTILDFIRKQPDWTIIQGNTDKLIADYNPEIIENLKSKYPVMAQALENDVNLLKDDEKEFLRNLPPQKELEIEGVKILMVHGSPRRNNEDIMPNMPLKEVEEMLEGVKADLIFCGHTHLPAGYQTNQKQTVVNVGSVGRPMTSDAKSCYVVANFQDGGFSIEHRFVDYDRETAAAIVRARGFEGADVLSEMILHPNNRHA